MKLKGDYLALGTLGFSIIVESVLKNWISLTRGPNRRFLTISEDDMLDLVEDESAAARMHATLRQEIARL